MFQEYSQPQFISTIYSPDEDGITHINIYSRSNTQLGRLLSNFAHSPFTHPEYGDFQSMEGYWYWVATGMKNDILRTLHGVVAKRTGQMLKRVPFRHLTKTFDDVIAEGLMLKMLYNPVIANQLKDSVLPLVHYYHDGCVEDEDSYRFAQLMEIIRKELKN
jgi:hypothetical protein